ncbi:ferredoxin [Halorussus aquaticus]|uniref:Ferredoxin n=1 Tax=Halorussus aquaticus TaxID=2953748 RepID=A0ABD5PZG7_9EURY|nr:ferredoxin [Halorussus aquaticus]
MYRVTIDTDACDGIFACLTRDDRFAEGEDGLATIEADGETVRREDGRVVAEFDDDRRADAEQAAEACPPGAISVETVGELGGGPDE